MSQSFTPTDVVDMTKEKDWPARLGMLDWDSTNIVFTKRSLIEFLKYTGTTVDPNLTNIQKLPRYAKFGKITGESTAKAEAEPESSGGPTSPSGDFKPSRRVRTVPGGAHSDIFSHHNDDGDALSTAPRKEPPPETTTTRQSETARTTISSEAQQDVDTAGPSGTGFKPTRRVRAAPGGSDSISSLWEVADEPGFKPSRRVREGPGGQDNINRIF